MDWENGIGTRVNSGGDGADDDLPRDAKELGEQEKIVCCSGMHELKGFL